MGSLAHRISGRAQQAPQFQSTTRSVPAPVLGWNARDNLADMDPRFALRMDNYFPDGNQVRLRSGTVDHVTGLPSVVDTLHELAIGNQRNLVAFSGGNSYDVTLAGVVGAPLATGFSNSRWIGVNAGATGGETALYANGVDASQSYDGTTWAPSGLTGPTNLNGLNVSNKRVWGFEEGTGQAWYWPVEAVTGAGSAFDIGSVVPSGGDLLAIGTMTVDGGEGLNDLTVFIMRSGAVVIYAGTNPADAAAWALRGVWNGGNPIGNRCLVSFGNDLILISDAGFLSLLKFTQQLGRVEAAPLSDSIRNAVNDASLANENNFGWEGIYNPHARQLIFNIPTIEGSTSDQYVMNSFTGSWCRFKNWDAFSWSHLDHNLYYGGDGVVVRANIGGTDRTESIAGVWQSAWNYFGLRGREKHFTQYRPSFKSNAAVSVQLGIGTDFEDPTIEPSVLSQAPVGAIWDVSEWDVGEWASGLVVTNDWIGAGDTGFNASVIYSTTSKDATIQFLSTDFTFEVGGVI